MLHFFYFRYVIHHPKLFPFFFLQKVFPTRLRNFRRINSNKCRNETSRGLRNRGRKKNNNDEENDRRKEREFSFQRFVPFSFPFRAGGGPRVVCQIRTFRASVPTGTREEITDHVIHGSYASVYAHDISTCLCIMHRVFFDRRDARRDSSLGNSSWRRKCRQFSKSPSF